MPRSDLATPSTVEPLYRRLADVLAGEIAGGRPGLGDALPAEADLATRFAASRHPVRAAVDVLHERGMVMRRNGARTRVIAARPRETFTQSVGTLSQLMNYPADTYRENVGSEHMWPTKAWPRSSVARPARRGFASARCGARRASPSRSAGTRSICCPTMRAS